VDKAFSKVSRTREATTHHESEVVNRMHGLGARACGQGSTRPPALCELCALSAPPQHRNSSTVFHEAHAILLWATMQLSFISAREPLSRSNQFGSFLSRPQTLLVLTLHCF
jgi:hypothetical protein